MTREKAIKIIKEFINGTCLHLVDQEALETLIPELKESEDERIRKELIEFIQWSVDRRFMREDFHQAKRPSEWIAWLEKQKEKSEIPIMDGDTDTYFDDLRMTTKPLTSREWFGEGIKYAQRLQKEQKPVEPSGKLSREEYLYQLLIDQLITYSDYEYLTGKNPAWKEEDEAHRDFILESLEDQIRFCKKDTEGAHYAKQIRTAQKKIGLKPSNLIGNPVRNR